MSETRTPRQRDELRAYFCILFSMTGLTALIQSSWLHAPGETHAHSLTATEVPTDAASRPRSVIALFINSLGNSEW